MAWDPDVYNKFKEDRFLPFYDLLALIKISPGLKVIDLGCGTGELTRKLADALPGAEVLGIDSSEEMLKDSSTFSNDLVQFEHRSIEEQLNLQTKWDIVFSNAAIQWVDNHETLLPRIISHIIPGGQLVVQVPAQHHNISNKILNDLAGEEPFSDALHKWKRTSPVLDTERYAQLLFENGAGTMTVYEKIYPLVLKDSIALFDWVSGTAMIPYTERLQGKTREAFITEYKNRLQKNFNTLPVFYPFKRVIIHAAF